MITHLSTGDLPISERSARKILMLADYTGWWCSLAFFYPKSRHGRRKLLPLKQLYIPATLKLDILKSFMNKDLAINRQKHCLRQLDRKMFDFICTLLYCRHCKKSLMAKKRTHPNKTP